jgi:hypothetical protein
LAVEEYDMDALLSLLVSCSLHLDDALVLGVIDAFSAGNPYTVRNSLVLEDEAELLDLEMPPQSAAEARAAVDHIVAAGGDPVVGLLPLRPAWLEELAKPAGALFDSCQGVEVATAKLSEFDFHCRHRGANSRVTARRACTLERYGASLGLPALGRFVLVSLAHTPAAPVESTPSSSSAASLFRPGGIFFPGTVP